MDLIHLMSKSGIRPIDLNITEIRVEGLVGQSIKAMTAYLVYLSNLPGLQDVTFKINCNGVEYSIKHNVMTMGEG